ncbi:MAG: cbb3-type cytochrome c oxidase subunit II [Acidimicrobiia bacterium]
MTTEIEATTRRAVAHRYLMVSAVFAVVGGVLLALNFLQLVWPDLDNGVAFLTYGRVRPMALNAIVYGWLSLGLLGAAFHIVPKLTGAPLWRPQLATGALAAVSLSLAVGVVLIGGGSNQGGLLFEIPSIGGAGVAIGLALAAFVLVRSAAAAPESDQPALWFSVAGALWLPLGFVAGWVPGLEGVNAALQNAFGVTSVITLAVTSLALGAAYYVAGELRGSQQGTSVGRIGFWSFAFIAAWTAPRLLVFGPAPDWLETIAVAFSIILLVPAIALLSDLAGWLRGVAQRKLLIAGGAFLLAFVVLNMVSSFRSPSSLTRLTSWEDALLLLPLLGTAGCWLLAFEQHFADRRGRWAGRLVVEGTGLAVMASLAGGLQQGITWVGGANAGAPVSAGEVFAMPSTAWVVLAAVGVTAAAIGMVGFAVGVLRGRGERSAELALEFIPEEEEEAPEPAEPIGFPLLVRGAVALFALAAASVFLIPTLDAPNRTATLAADAIEFAEGSLPALGADLYVSEGCVYCHTQQVRPIITDVGLGTVSMPGDYARQDPVLLGYRRVGPDLTHIGSRTTSTRGLLERLRSPRSSFDDGGEWDIMPSYDYLSDDDLLAIAEYLGALN